jgi:hypothetical protein
MSDQLDAERAAVEEHYRAGCIDALSSAIAERLAQPVLPLRYLPEEASGRMMIGSLPILRRCMSEWQS